MLSTYLKREVATEHRRESRLYIFPWIKKAATKDFCFIFLFFDIAYLIYFHIKNFKDEIMWHWNKYQASMNSSAGFH